jgi:hypothetical protein
MALLISSMRLLAKDPNPLVSLHPFDHPWLYVLGSILHVAADIKNLLDIYA